MDSITQSFAPSSVHGQIDTRSYFGCWKPRISLLNFFPNFPSAPLERNRTELVTSGHKGSRGPTAFGAEDALGTQPPRESLWSLWKENGSGMRPSTLQCFFLSYSPRRLAIKPNLSCSEPAGGGDPVVSLGHDDRFARSVTSLNENAPHTESEL